MKTINIDEFFEFGRKRENPLLTTFRIARDPEGTPIYLISFQDAKTLDQVAGFIDGVLYITDDAEL